MKITLFKNGKGLIHGSNAKRVSSDTGGTLKIGANEMDVKPGENIMPLLSHGATADYNAMFTDCEGKAYNLGTVAVRSGRISPPSATAVEIMELRCKTEILEAENESLHNEIEELRNIFDTNSLNFLI